MSIRKCGFTSINFVPSGSVITLLLVILVVNHRMDPHHWDGALIKLMALSQLLLLCQVGGRIVSACL